MTSSDTHSNSELKSQDELKSLVLVNFLWMFGGNGVGAALKLAVLLVLARLLTPADFGLVSAAITVVGLAELLGRVGVVPFLVRTPELTPAHLKTATLVTNLLGIFLGVVTYLASDAIASLYRMPDIAPILRVFSIYFVILSLGMVSQAMLERRMQFKYISLLSVVSYFLGYAVVAVTLSLLGFGPWSLVFAQIAQAVIQVAGLQYFARVGVPIGFDWQCFKSMLHFSGGVTLTQLGNYAARNVDYMIVGRFLGATALGFYSRAYLLLMQPANMIGSMGDKVLYPALSAVQEDRPRMVRALNQTLALCAMIQIPVSILLVIIGPEVVLVLLGDQFEGAIIAFQVLIASLFFRTGFKFLVTAFRATGHVYAAAAWQWGYAAVLTVAALIGLTWGIAGVAAGVTLTIVLTYIVGGLILHRLADVDLAPSYRAIFRYIGVGVVQTLLTLWLRSWLIQQGIGNIGIFLIVPAATFAVFASLFFAVPKAFGDEGQIIAGFIKKRLKKG